jgi:hypothetical protein
MFKSVKVTGTAGTEQRILNNYKYLRLVLPGTFAGTVLAQTLVTGTDWIESNHSLAHSSLRDSNFECNLFINQGEKCNGVPYSTIYTQL